jgi:hypothetical protein
MILTIKQLAWTREKRRHQESPSTRLKKSMKRQREKERAIERFEIRMLKGQK